MFSHEAVVELPLITYIFFSPAFASYFFDSEKASHLYTHWKYPK